MKICMIRLNLAVFSRFLLVFVTLFSTAAVQAGDKKTADVALDASDICPIKVGENIPEISLSTTDGKRVSLNKLVAEKPALLIFYRGGWCPYCNTHLGELKTIEKDLKELDYQIIAVSPDLPENLKESVDKQALTYSLLSDSKADAAKALGLAYRVNDETMDMLLSYKIDIEKASGEKHRILPVPAALLIDSSGKVTFSFVSPDYTVRVDKRVILAAAQSQAAKK